MSGEKVSAIHLPHRQAHDAQGAADFLGLDDKTIIRWAGKGYLPGHPLGEGKRKFWRFLESELSDWLALKTNRAVAA